MTELDELLLRLFLVIIVGGVIGAEREFHNKSAGFRTMILICLGSFLFTTFGIAISGSSSDRIASNIVTGIGFLGAGTIFKSDNRINGLTTAAAIWITAALGMGIADGFYELVLISTAVVFVSLYFFPKLEEVIDNYNQSRTYKIQSAFRDNLLESYEEVIKSHGLKFKRVSQRKSGDVITGAWLVRGRREKHNNFIRTILHDPGVLSFDF